MRNYVYKVKSKWLKLRKDGSRDIEEYFSKFTSALETGGCEEIYSISYRLLPDSTLVRGDVSLLNDPKWQKAAKLSEHIDEFAKEGLLFSEIVNKDGSITYVLQEDEETLKDFEMCRLCVDTIDEETHGMLFILRSDGHTMYYNTKVLHDNMPDIIDKLLADDVIYKRLAPEAPKQPKKNEKIIAKA